MQMAILLRGGALGDSTFRLCSLTSTSSSLHVSQNVAIPNSSSSSPILHLIASKFKTASRHRIICSAVQESSPSTAATAETKEVKEAPKANAETKEEVKEAPKTNAEAKEEVKEAPKATAEAKEEVKEAPKAAVKKPPAKAPAKPLPQMMEEDVIPALKAIFEAQEDFSNIELVFKDNKLEGSFLKKGNPYSFWAFFPTGNLIGPKGFSLSSYNTGASTVEPFLIDEKKITAKHVIFWVEKRLAAQGIIPVWKD